jgi:hypothetical protein
MVKIFRFDSKISLTDALYRIVRKSAGERSPFWHARFVLHRAIERGEIALMVDGKLVDPGYFMAYLYVDADETTGHAGIGTRIALVKRLDEYNWTLSRADVNRFIHEERYKEL